MAESCPLFDSVMTLADKKEHRCLECWRTRKRAEAEVVALKAQLRQLVEATQEKTSEPT